MTKAPSVVPTTAGDHGVAGSAVAVAAVGVVGLLAVVSLFVGVSDLDVTGLLTRDQDAARILVVSRIPRLLAILLSGAAMAVAGLVMQHLARNRFVAPSTAGTVEAATLGILVATMVFGGASLIAKMAVAVVFSLVGTAIFVVLVRRIPYRDVILVPLVGIMFGAVISALTTFVAYRHDLLQTLGTWTAGDFSGVLRGRYELLWLAAGVTLLGYLYADRFTVAGMGRDVAVNLGLAHQRVVAIGLAIVATITGVVVVVVGAVPFLGLVVPNVVTMAMGDNLRRVLPVTALAGAGFVLACDIVGRLVRFPYEIPVGTVAGVVGSVVFLALIMRGRAHAH